MQRIVTLISGLLLAASLTGCGGGGEEAPEMRPEERATMNSTVLKQLSAPDEAVRLFAVNAIAAMGKDGAEAIPQLEKLETSDPSPKVREAATAALQKVR